MIVCLRIAGSMGRGLPGSAGRTTMKLKYVWKKNLEERIKADGSRFPTADFGLSGVTSRALQFFRPRLPSLLSESLLPTSPPHIQSACGLMFVNQRRKSIALRPGKPEMENKQGSGKLDSGVWSGHSKFSLKERCPNRAILSCPL
jgi:hypothetical protein